MNNSRGLVAGLFLLLLVGCRGSDNNSPTAFNSNSEIAALAKSGGSKAVYTMSNAASGNSILAFSRDGDGSLAPSGSYSTGGLGTGAGLGNQGALRLEGKYLFAVNAGSNDISALRVTGDALTLVDRIASGGVRPVSITVHGKLVYVLNAGGTGNISGFRFDSGIETFSPITGSTRALSSAASGPAQIEFTPSGNVLVVTEKATNVIDTFPVGATGVAGPAISQPSVGVTPFGFAFSKHGQLIVSNAVGGAAGQSSLSSYSVGGNGGINLISGQVASGQSAACWVIVTKNGKYAYVTNTASGNVSSYEISRNGELTLAQANAAPSGAGPIDMALSNNSQYLYVNNAGSNSITVFRVNNGDGSVTPVSGGVNIPAGANGLAAQ